MVFFYTTCGFFSGLFAGWVFAKLTDASFQGSGGMDLLPTAGGLCVFFGGLLGAGAGFGWGAHLAIEGRHPAQLIAGRIAAML